MKVLILEDMPEQAFIVQHQLKKLGFTCEMCFNPFLALTKIKSFDIIVTDIGMPEMDGIQFIKKARELTKAPIVVISNYAQEWDKDFAFDAGANYYLIKPLLPGDLKRVFNQWI
jgi:two-component system, chemotaxis family, chemotaxis protein CheY